jgi:hypothetical protein
MDRKYWCYLFSGGLFSYGSLQKYCVGYVIKDLLYNPYRFSEECPFEVSFKKNSSCIAFFVCVANLMVEAEKEREFIVVLRLLLALLFLSHTDGTGEQ